MRARRPVLAAELGKSRACAIRERAVGIERARELALDLVERRVGRARPLEGRSRAAARIQEPPQRARRRERDRRFPQLLWTERATHAQTPDRLAQIGHFVHGQRGTFGEELRRFARLGKPSPYFLAARRKRPPEGQVFAHRARASQSERAQEP
jgi:hypothetical protein